jgi:hypothetical protein
MTTNQATDTQIFNGGCLCGALRYRARGTPLFAGLCYCRDCQKASGSAFTPYIGFRASAVEISGETRSFATVSARGTPAKRHFCPRCASIVFGGEVEADDWITVYAGTLDDPALFHPTSAIFTRDRAPWAPIPHGLVVHDGAEA